MVLVHSGGRGDGGGMKYERAFKRFSLLSLAEKPVPGKSVPAPGGSQPRLTPESVRDFDVQHAGSAEPPQPEPRGATRRWPGRYFLPVEFRQSRRRWRALPISHHGCLPGQSGDIPTPGKP